MSSDYEALQELLRPFGSGWTPIPPHVIRRLASVVSTTDVAYLDSDIDKGDQGFNGQVVAITRAGAMVRLTLTGATDRATTETRTCTLRIEPLRGRVKAIDVDQSDWAWLDRWMQPKTVHLRLEDPQEELTLPLTRQDTGEFLAVILAAAGLK